MLKTLLCSAALCAALPLAATAATFTYDFDFTFDMSGDNVGGFRDEGPGGALTGFFTIDDSNTILDFSFDFQIIQRAGRFQPDQTDDVNLTFGTNDLFSSQVLPAVGGKPPETVFGFAEVDNAVNCSFRNAVGSPFSLTFNTFDFTPGDSTASFTVRSSRNSPFCNQFGALGFDTRQPNTQTQISLGEFGTLRVTDTPAVPLPASGLLLMGGLALAGGMARRRAQKG